MSQEVTFVDEQAAKAYECGICLRMMRNPTQIDRDQLIVRSHTVISD